jgi:hypothetical protein
LVAHEHMFGGSGKLYILLFFLFLHAIFSWPRPAWIDGQHINCEFVLEQQRKASPRRRRISSRFRFLLPVCIRFPCIYKFFFKNSSSEIPPLSAPVYWYYFLLIKNSLNIIYSELLNLLLSILCRLLLGRFRYNDRMPRRNYSPRRRALSPRYSRRKASLRQFRVV